MAHQPIVINKGLLEQARPSVYVLSVAACALQRQS